MSDIDAAIAAVEGGNPSVDKMHQINLVRFVDLKDVPKLRVCHQVAKHDPSVIIGARIALEHSDKESVAEELDCGNGNDGALVVYDPNKNPPPQQTNLNTFLLKPPLLLLPLIRQWINARPIWLSFLTWLHIGIVEDTKKRSKR